MSDPDPEPIAAPVAPPAARITLRYGLTEADVVSYITAVMNRFPTSKSESAWIRYRVVFSSLAGVYFAVQSFFAHTGMFGVGGPAGSTVLGMVYLLFAFAAFAYHRTLRSATVVRVLPESPEVRAASPKYQYLVGAYTLTVTPERIHQIGPHDELVQTWSGISYAARVDDTVYIIRNDQFCIIIPTRAIGSHLQADEFVAKLNAYRRAAGDSGFDRFAEYLAQHDVACPTCGYNLRNVATRLCPECGIAIPGSVMAGKAEPNR